MPLSAPTLDNRYDVRRAQTPGSGTDKQHFPRNSFIDLAKAYDSVDRVLLWKVLARFGVPPWMIKAIHIFHDCMGARVQLDGGDFLAWFNVCQGLWQSPLLFNIFFAAVIIVEMQRVAEDPLIVSDLMYLDDAPKGEDGRFREEGTSGNGPASGVGDAVCGRCGGGVDIASWAYQDDGRYSCRMSGIRTDRVGKKIPRP